MRTRGTLNKLGSSLTLPQFQVCFANDQATLAPLRHIPAEVRDLLIRNDAIAKEFKVNTRTHSLALRFVPKNRIEIISDQCL